MPSAARKRTGRSSAFVGAVEHLTDAADAMRAALMKRADALMGCLEGSPEEAELASIVDAIEAYEVKRWPLGKCRAEMIRLATKAESEAAPRGRHQGDVQPWLRQSNQPVEGSLTYGISEQLADLFKGNEDSTLGVEIARRALPAPNGQQPTAATSDRPGNAQPIRRGRVSSSYSRRGMAGKRLTS